MRLNSTFLLLVRKKISVEYGELELVRLKTIVRYELELKHPVDLLISAIILQVVDSHRAEFGLTDSSVEGLVIRGAVMDGGLLYAGGCTSDSLR